MIWNHMTCDLSFSHLTSHLFTNMSERKAINKYYPPDWDPAKVPKKVKSSNPGAEKVRLMLPFSMKCLQCNEYISARRKFNARKETTSEKYMSFKIIKFHIKCPRCNNSIVFRTDPKTAGFAPVEGGVRNYESQTETKIKPIETEDEILERLEKEDSENKKFQEQKKKRKHNPFWQDQQRGKDISEFEDKLIEQQKEQEIHDHLTYLQARAKKLQESGGADQVASDLKNHIALEISGKRQLHIEEVQDGETASKMFKKLTPESHPVVLSGVITVRRRLEKPAKKVFEAKPASPPSASSSAPPSMSAVLTGYSSSDEE